MVLPVLASSACCARIGTELAAASPARHCCGGATAILTLYFFETASAALTGLIDFFPAIPLVLVVDDKHPSFFENFRTAFNP